MPIETAVAEPHNVVRLPAQHSPAPLSMGVIADEFERAWAMAEKLSSADILPPSYKRNPGNVLVAIQWGLELGLKPLQAMQNIAVINGKPGIYGDLGKALLFANGCTIIEEDTREIAAKGFATCTIKRAGKPDVTRTFGIEDAKRARLWGKDGPWTSYPERQMAWRAFWWAARDAAPDILRGMAGAEELRDTERDVTPEGSHETVPAAAPKAPSKTAALKQKLQIVNVTEVLAALDEASTPDELQAAVEKAKGLKSEDDRNKASEHYKAALERLRKAAAPEFPSDDAIIARIKACADAEAVDLYLDELRPIEKADAARYAVIVEHAKARKAGLALE